MTIGDTARSISVGPACAAVPLRLLSAERPSSNAFRRRRLGIVWADGGVCLACATRVRAGGWL